MTNAKIFLTTVAVCVACVCLCVEAYPLLKQGNKGEDVYSVQYFSSYRGYYLSKDGDFGPNTANGVKSFQRSRGLTADGIVGSQTWGAYVVTVRRGDPTSDAVRALQRQLAQVYGYSIAVDGQFGPGTEGVVETFQASKGLSADGIVGPITWETLFDGTTVNTTPPPPEDTDSDTDTDTSAPPPPPPNDDLPYPQDTDWGDLEDIPAELKGTQDGLSYPSSSFMESLLGTPCPFTESCTTVTNPDVAAELVSKNVGPFSAYGMEAAVDSLARIFAQVKVDYPTLYETVGYSGMLCCRAIRGSSSSYSNHSWGLAIDLNMNGVLDPRYDDKAQKGLHALYPYFHAEGWYWAAGYSTSYEDAMHFDVARETIQAWHDAGVI